ncbi:MAG: hypothetical protein K0R57_2376 [Paenibacillaceae bacterium]|jgi:hypothetical protein|nr:hypothetical protein [Paenibacillaceae bacterium]
MNILEQEDGYRIETGSYRITARSDRFEAGVGDHIFFELSVRSEVATAEGSDVDEELLQLDHEQTGEGVVLVWRTRSSLWEQKAYMLDCREDRFLYKVQVTGSGKLHKLAYFSGAGRTVCKGSRYDASHYALPVAAGGGADVRVHTTAQNGELTLGYMAPPQFCFPFRMEGAPQWLGLGLAARPGAYNFDSFAYRFHAPYYGLFRMYLETDLKGYTTVNGQFETPAILGGSGGDEWEVLRHYSRWHYTEGGCANPREEGSGPVGANEDAHPHMEPSWWSGPFFCGWGEQNSIERANPFVHANERAYTAMSDRLDELGLKPTVIIIDDKWQRYYGESLPDPGKWPSLRAYTDREHAKGRRVVLWFKTWNTEGLDADECVTLWTQPLGADPTNPKYRERMKRTIRLLLSDEEGCCNCDGFKIDFANCMPLGPDLRTSEPGVYGVELLKRMMALLYEAAKEVKSDALINCSACHPYFAEVADQIRLHDYYGGMRHSVDVMTHRAALFQAAMPGISMDTDGASHTHYRDTMAYMRAAPKLGVPDLYNLSSTSEAPLTRADWEEIRLIWEAYSRSLHAKGGEQK